MDIITDTIEKSWYKYDPFLTDVCTILLRKMDAYKIPIEYKGFNKCWLFQQILFMIKQDLEKKGKRLNISYGWFKDGVVVDPGMIMIQTKGKIKFKWDEYCPGCQIADECCCIGNPNNNNYKKIEEKLNWLGGFRYNE